MDTASFRVRATEARTLRAVETSRQPNMTTQNLEKLL